MTTGRPASTLLALTAVHGGPSEEQLLVVEHRGRPARLMAGPGTGKTNVFAWRVKDLIEQSAVAPDEILVLSFSRLAASELGARIRQYRSGTAPSPQTLHSYALAQLRRARAWSVCGTNIIDDWELANFFRQDITNHLGGTIGATTDLLKAMATDWRTLAREEEPLPADQANLERVLRELRPVYDFALLSELVFRFKRWAMAEPSFKPVYRYVLVDEFQDLNHCDQAAVHLIQRRSGAELLVAGDDDQSIYGWRDAAPHGIREFPTKFSAVSYDLTECWRCGQNIIDDAWKVVERITGRATRPKMKSMQADPGEVVIVRSKTAARGVADVVRLVRALLKGKFTTSGEVLVLVPRSDFAKSYVKVLTKSGVHAINYVRPGDVLDLFEIRRLTYALRLSSEPDDPLAVRAMFKLAGGIGSARIKEITTRAVHGRERFPLAARKSTDKRVLEVLADLTALPHIDRMTPWPVAIATMAAHLGTPQAELDEFIAFIKTVVPDETEELETCLLTVREFRVDAQSSSAYPPDGPVRVMTMGQAKGLSAEAVIVADLDDEIVPGNLDEDEQRRKLYVAMTRARRLLYLFYCTGRARSRTAYAGTGSSVPSGAARSLSRFLDDLDHEAVDISDLIRTLRSRAS